MSEVLLIDQAENEEKDSGPIRRVVVPQHVDELLDEPSQCPEPYDRRPELDSARTGANQQIQGCCGDAQNTRKVENRGGHLRDRFSSVALPTPAKPPSDPGEWTREGWARYCRDVLLATDCVQQFTIPGPASRCCREGGVFAVPRRPRRITGLCLTPSVEACPTP